MAPKLPPCKVCNKKESGKYTCPMCHVAYCSVVCFKQHKTNDCRSPTTYEPPPLPLLPPAEDRNEHDERPRKRLKELHWPAEPNPMLWDDPLQRDDVKPLRHFELEAIATSPALRALLASPTLRTTLTRLLALPHHAREPSLRVLLGLPPEPAPAHYRPDPGRRFATGVQTRQEQQAHERGGVSSGARGRGGRGRGGGGRGGHGGGAGRGPRLLESTLEERGEVGKFAEEVSGILQGARERKG
ncbi:hypothetical protein JCM5296_002427 [Sporobolomyces johnsonii]